jgi:hypothetical protein
MTQDRHTQPVLDFHQQNPQVYTELVRLARQAKDHGKEKMGIGMLWEVMRWNIFITTTDPNSNFKLNNNYRSRYARMIMQNEWDLTGFFETRKLSHEN